MMVSGAFRKLEDKTADVQLVHNDLVQEIAYKVKMDKDTVEKLLYQTCVTTCARAIDVAFIVNEFLVFLDEKEVK